MQTRSDFLAAGTLAMLTPPFGASAPPASPQPSLPPLHFDLPAFNATLNAAAHHRLLFAATKLNGAVILDAMRNTLNAYLDLGVALTDVRPVAVFYHGVSVALAFDDAMWNQYFIPALGKSKSDFKKDFDSVYTSKTHGNPCLHKQGGHEDTSIESLIADAGARFFVCNNATQGFARYLIAPILKKSAVAIYDDLVAHLVPNAALVPAGVWAVHAIQEQKYTLLQTSL